MTSRRALCAFGSCALVVACALPSGLSGGGGPTTEGDGGVDGGATGSGTGTPDSGMPPGDSGTVGDADAGAPLVNLASNADFALGCAGWDVFNGTTTGSPNGRNGTAACKVCGTAANLEFSQTVDLTTAPDQQYYGEVWVSATVEAAEPPIGLSVINEFKNGGNEEPVVTTGPATTTTWTKVTALLTTHMNGVGVTLDVTVGDSASHCFYIDDALVARIK